MLISSQELSSQDQLLQALHKGRISRLTQATLSRDLEAAQGCQSSFTLAVHMRMYLPKSTRLYKRVSQPSSVSQDDGPSYRLSTSINFSGNMVVIKTRPGYASSIAYNIDNSDITPILGTIAGDDTILPGKER